MPRRNKNIQPDDTWRDLDRLKDEMGLRGRTTIRKPKRGDIWFADLGKRGIHVQEGTRPVVIISIGAKIARVVPVTSNLENSWMREHVIIKPEDLEDVPAAENFNSGVAIAEQVTTISETALMNYIGKVSWESRKMLDICQALKSVLALR